MPTVYITKEDKLCTRLASYVYGELKTRRISQEKLADTMGITQPSLCRKLRVRQFSFNDFIRIVDFFEPDDRELSRLCGKGE